MKINVIDPIADSRWDEFITNQEQSTIFHSSAWAAVIKQAYGHLPRYYALENDAGEFKAAIPLFLIQSILTGKRLVCLPFSDSCCPLGEKEADIALLVNSVKKEIEKQSASYLEIRGWHNGVSPGRMGLLARHYHTSYIIDLEPNEETIKKRFHDSVRRGIRQAEKRGVTIRFTRSEDDLEHFYRLHVLTRKKLGVLPQPYAFFKAIYHHIISRHLGFLVMAEWDAKVVAAVLFLTYKDTIYYKFNASDENYLQKRPNHLAIWEAIRYACADGYKHFDFGRCSPEEEGLRTYKARWGAKEVDLPYYYYPKAKGVTTITENSFGYRAMRLISHAMPEFAFRAAGSLLYKHLA